MEMNNVDWNTTITSALLTTVIANLIAYSWYKKYLNKISDLNSEWLEDVKKTTVELIKKGQ